LINFKAIFVRYPKLFNGGIYRIKTSSKQLFLTFDDGPTPGVTEKVLELLKKYDAKAVFFCKGEKAVKQPDIIENILQDEHALGNHSYSHYNAFKVPVKAWLKDVLRHSPVSDAEFFRPPYGKITPCQFKLLKKRFNIVFWDVLTYDYRQDLTVEDIVKIIYKNVRNGSVIVFHDTEKAAPRMLPALENCLKYYSDSGYSFYKLQSLRI